MSYPPANGATPSDGQPGNQGDHPDRAALQPGHTVGSLLLIGINHHRAPVEIRERLAFSHEQLPKALQELRDCLPDPSAELALLATCNRSEIYFCTTQPTAAQEAVLNYLANHAGLPQPGLLDFIEVHQGLAAANHLLRVAAGLESLVVGENEILGQVKGAIAVAQAACASGPVVAALFRHAIQSGKRVRTETGIGKANLSVATVVVELAQNMLGPLAGRTALLIGAGKISSLTARALVRAGLDCILVANRTFDRAQKLAQSFSQAPGPSGSPDPKVRAVHFDALSESLDAADIVICSTGAPHIVLHAETLAEAMIRRENRPLLIADLAVPRDVDPAAAQLPGIRLVNIDDLAWQVQTHHLPASAACQQAAAIIQEELDCFGVWLAEQHNVALISSLQCKANAICQTQIQKTLRRNPDLSPEQQNAVVALAQAITSQLLHGPIQALKSPPPGTNSDQIAAIAQMLFRLN